MPRYPITLTREEKAALTKLCNTGSPTNKEFKYARALLLCDQGEYADYKWDLAQTAAAVGMTERSLINLRQRFTRQGMAALQRKPYKQRARVFDTDFEAQLTQILASAPPEGHRRWTLKLLAERVLELKLVDSVSVMTIQRALKHLKQTQGESQVKPKSKSRSAQRKATQA